MPMVAGPTSPTTDRTTAEVPIQTPSSKPMLMAECAVPKDAFLAWVRSEFAAANAIIDALCAHLAQLDTGSEYKEVFKAIHRRRLNWIPVLQMQKFHSVADVTTELRKVTEEKKSCEEVVEEEKKEKIIGEKEELVEGDGNDDGGCCDGGEVIEEEESPDSDITDSGSQEMQAQCENIDICANHEDCNARPDQIKLTKGFSAKEHSKGHMVNVVKGLKLYEDVFTDSELSKLTDFVNEMRVAGQHGELSGDTFILFNKQMKGNKRELVQFGIPIFGQVKEEAESSKQRGCIEPIPNLLSSVIDHLIQWNLIPEYKRPNGCIIHFFDEDEYSQPFQKPPHLEQPICSLLLSDSTLAFGRTLVSDNDGNYRGPLMLSLKKGSMVVMRGNSADVARHVMCPSPNKRVSITFFRVRPNTIQNQSPPTSPMAGQMTVWQPSVQGPYAVPNGAINGFDPIDAMPRWGIARPVIMLAPVPPVPTSPKRMPCDGTGVFLPWAVGAKKHPRHLPPRAQRGRFLKSPPPDSHPADSVSDKAIPVDGKSA